jgi:hypothetical protein
MKIALRTLVPIILATSLLAACGGGDDEGVFVEEKDPSPSGLPAAMAVAGATGPEATYNGAYSTTDIYLSDVVKVNPIGGRPETCRFNFSNLPQVTTSARGMTGDIRYLPGSAELNVAYISIDGAEFSIEGRTNAVTVSRATNRVVFTTARLNSTQGTGRSIQLTGEIPMRGDRPEGC